MLLVFGARLSWLRSNEAFEVNTMLWPSGDHVGRPPFTSVLAAEPSTFMTHTCSSVVGPSPPSPARLDANTIFFPSGDKLGDVQLMPILLFLVRGLAPDPS